MIKSLKIPEYFYHVLYGHGCRRSVLNDREKVMISGSQQQIVAIYK